MNEEPTYMNVPLYRPPFGVHGPTLGRDLPDGCERLGASLVPSSDEWWSSPVVSADTLYWWRFPPLKVTPYEVVWTADEQKEDER